MNRLLTPAIISCVLLLVHPSARAVLDINQNSLSDFWEKSYNNGQLFPAAFDPLADPDGDGWTNLEEATAGTDPFDPNPPEGILVPDIEITPPALPVPAQVRLTWPTLAGKTYQVVCSTALTPGSWIPGSDTFIGSGAPFTYDAEVVLPDGSSPDVIFWRVEVGDTDSDLDTLSDWEEGALGLDSYNAMSLPGFPDVWLATYFSEQLLSGGLGSINPNADSDGDGISDLEELLGGTDPNTADSPTSQRWLSLQGTGEVDVPLTKTHQFMVPAGQTVLVVVAVSSDEYPYYTDPETTSDFNDLLTWDIQPSVGDAIVGDIDVNSLHTDWEIAELLGETLPGLPGLVHYEKFKAFTAPPEAALTIDVEVSATNIGDGSLPSHIAVGVLPIEIVIPKVDQNGQEIPGQLVSADELNVSKMEQSLTVEKSGGAVSKLELDVAHDIDRFRIRILGGAGIAEAKKVTAKVKTAGNADAKYDDPDTEIELNVDGGDLITKSLMLVSDDIDDAFSGPVDVGAEEQEGDRTHVIQLGGKLTVSKLLFDIDECELDARRPIHAKKQVTLNFVILDDGNVDVQEMRDTIARDLEAANERFAQVGIRVLSGGIDVETIPEAVVIVDGAVRVDVPGDDKKLSSSIRTIVEDRGTAGDLTDIHVFYVPFSLDGAFVTGADGVALNGHFNKQEDAGYLSNIFMTKSPWSSTLAHELGHILTNFRHLFVFDFVDKPEYLDKFRTNIMTDDVTINGGIIESKRFFKSQENIMRQHSLAEDP